MGEDVAARGAVRQLEPLAGAEQVHGVIADDVAAAYGVNAASRV